MVGASEDKMMGDIVNVTAGVGGVGLGAGTGALLLLLLLLLQFPEPQYPPIPATTPTRMIISTTNGQKYVFLWLVAVVVGTIGVALSSAVVGNDDNIPVDVFGWVVGIGGEEESVTRWFLLPVDNNSPSVTTTDGTGSACA